MKLLRVGNKGAEKPAILHTDGTYRDLSSVVPDIAGATIGADGLARIKAADASKLPVLAAGSRIGPCVGNVGKFICVGLNYADHAAESGMQVPPEPVLFLDIGEDEFFLRWKVIVEGRLGYPGLGDDAIDADRVDAVLVKKTGRGFEQALARGARLGSVV